MRVNDLSFDTAAMLRNLQRWVECESPTFEASAVNRMMDMAAADLVSLGATVERIRGPAGFGDCVLGRLPHRNSSQPGILILGHLDTVHPIGTLTQLPFRIAGDYCYGPGIVDMKGGNRIALDALAALAAVGHEAPLPVTVLFTCDEEIGSPGTRELIEAEAKRHRYVLVPEPAMADGGVVTGRYAIARFKLKATGRPSHAGAALADGRSAIREMANRLIEIEEMTGPDCTYSVGVIKGGQWVNCVPTQCEAEALSMAKRQSDLDAGIARMLALSVNDGDAGFKVELGVVRPVWEPNAATLDLFEFAKSLYAGSPALTHDSSGGGSDANFTGALGLPTLDGLGVRGAGIHTLTERMEIASLAERAQLLANMIATLH